MYCLLTSDLDRVNMAEEGVSLSLLYLHSQPFYHLRNIANSGNLLPL